MTRVAVATTLSARRWESDLVAKARETALVRVVSRAYDLEDVARYDPDVVVAGSETSWVTTAQVGIWRRHGARVIGIHPPGDQPGRNLFLTAGADEILTDDTPSISILRTIRALATQPTVRSSDGRLVAVTGPRGAPGRTEVAIALAAAAAKRHSTLLIDLDPPSIGLRLGLPPNPGLAEVFESLRYRGELPTGKAVGFGDFSVISGADGGPLSAGLRSELVRTGLSLFGRVVVDLGPWPHEQPLIHHADDVVLVCEASPTSLVRAASLVREWAGPTPRIVLNRIDLHDDLALRRARAALGLEPAALVPDLSSLRHGSRHASPPPDALLIALQPVLRANEATL